MSLHTYQRRLKALRNKLYPPPKQETWVPRGLCLIEEDGVLYYADDAAKAIDERCKKLGVTPNIYIVSDDWHPDMDGIEP